MRRTSARGLKWGHGGITCRSGNVAVAVVLALVAVSFMPRSASAASGITTRVSVAASGKQGNSGSGGPDLSADGRYLSFVSSASNLVSGDTNDRSDIFVRDNETGVVARVNVSNGGAQANDDSFAAAISADGRYVVFRSLATNLVSNDSNNTHDVFVHDRLARTVVRVNLSTDGSQARGDGGSHTASSISGDGRYVAFTSPAPNLVFGDTNGAEDIFVRDLHQSTTTRVNLSSSVPPLPGLEAVGHSSHPSMSADGRYVAFDSNASNLVAGDTNLAYDVFVHDRWTATTTRVSVASNGTQASGGSMGDSQVPTISADGNAVVFRSGASNLVDRDQNDEEDIFVHNRSSATTTRVSVASDGTEGDRGSGSGNNLRVAALSADGTKVAFRSGATNLVAGDTNGEPDIFLHEPGKTTRVSVGSDGRQANAFSTFPALSANGDYVAFGSLASNLVPGDTNGQHDVFIHHK